MDDERLKDLFGKFGNVSKLHLYTEIAWPLVADAWLENAAKLRV